MEEEKDAYYANHQRTGYEKILKAFHADPVDGCFAGSVGVGSCSPVGQFLMGNSSAATYTAASAIKR